MKHNSLTSFFIFFLSVVQNNKINKLLTLVFVLLGPVLAIITFISADLFEKTTSTILLRNLLLLDLIYVLIIAGLVAVRITKLILSRRSRTSGSRLHTRLTKVFTLIALLPTIIVAIFATISINFGLEGWFSSNVQKVVENSMMAAKAYENEQKQYLVNDLNYLANVLNSEISKNRLIEEGYVRNVLSKFQPNSISESFIIDFTGDIRLRGERSYLFDFEKISNADIDKAISGQIVIIKDWPTNELRVNSRKEVVDMVQSKVIGMTKSQVCEMLDGIPAAPINKISEALADAQSIARGVVTDWNGHSVLASPLRFISERE